MSVSTMFVIAYVLFFTFAYGLTTILFYFFGFIFDKKLRTVSDRVELPPRFRFLFRFNGIEKAKKGIPSRIAAKCEIYSLIYFVVMELLSLALCVIINDCILVCRISVGMFLLSVVVWLVLLIRVNRLVKKQIRAIDDYEFEHIFDTNETLDIQSADDFNRDKVELDEEEKIKRSEMLKRMMGDDSELEGETLGIAEGMKAVSDVIENLKNLNEE